MTMPQLRIVNPTSEPYEGSAVGFLPLDGDRVPSNVLTTMNGETLPTDVKLTLNDPERGFDFHAYGKVTGAHGAALNLYATIPGIYGPGTTSLNVLGIDFAPPSTPKVPAVVNVPYALDSYLCFRYQVGHGGPILEFNTRLDAGSLAAYQGVRDGNPGFFKSQYNIPLGDPLSKNVLRLTFHYLAGEHGIRLRIGVRNTNLNRWIKTTQPGESIYIHRCMVATPKPSAQAVIEAQAAYFGLTPAEAVAKFLPSTFDGSPLESYEATIANANTGIGEAQGDMLTIIDGRQKGTVRLNGIGEDVEIAELWAPDGAIPNGDLSHPAGIYGKSLRPQEGKPLDANHDQLSGQFVTVMPGLRLIHEVYIGHPKPHAQLVRPTIVRWENTEFYSARAVHTGLPDMQKLVDSPAADASRFADVITAHSVGPETIYDHRERGRYYPIPPEQNPYLGYRDFGGINWNGGFTTACHYDQLGSYFVNALSALPQNVGAWLEIACQGGLHAVQAALYMCNSHKQNARGAATYESGSGFTGIYAAPASSHSWIHGLIWQALMFHDFDAIEQLVAFVQHTRTYYDFWGTTFGAAQEAVGLDPRDYQTVVGLQRYSDVPTTDWNPIKPQGDQGDFGVRRPPRILEQWCYLRALWLLPVEDDIRNNVEQTLRMEKHWLERGYFLNRVERGKGFEDAAKPWQAFYLARALNWARSLVELTPEQIAGIERITAVAVEHISLVNGVYFPDGRITVHPSPEGKELLRGGLTPKTVSYLQDATGSGSSDEKLQAWALFMSRFDVDVMRNIAENTQPNPDQALWNYPTLKTFRALVQAVEDTIPTQGAAAIDVQAPALLALVSKVTELREFKGLLYMALFSDLLAFRRLKGWNTPAEDAVYEQARKSPIWYHTLGRGQNPHPSDLGFKVAGRYPTTESKCWGAMLDTRSLQVDLESLA